ncbi:hypothetical protein E2C01_013289 [Portunus trituberculatus]|uniref:Uncharacterized protein n=1 Tax=Portunus trituberculatus TaxID=210409 RepID=A0A5B7DGP2_PORTR|nr:hypothetical protein [Portunus trituberculatus]
MSTHIASGGNHTGLGSKKINNKQNNFRPQNGIHEHTGRHCFYEQEHLELPHHSPGWGQREHKDILLHLVQKARECNRIVGKHWCQVKSIGSLQHGLHSWLQLGLSLSQSHWLHGQQPLVLNQPELLVFLLISRAHILKLSQPGSELGLPLTFLFHQTLQQANQSDTLLQHASSEHPMKVRINQISILHKGKHSGSLLILNSLPPLFSSSLLHQCLLHGLHHF